VISQKCKERQRSGISAREDDANKEKPCDKFYFITGFLERWAAVAPNPVVTEC